MKWYNSTFAECLGIMLICIGIGTCAKLVSSDPKIPLIEFKQIKTEVKQENENENGNNTTRRLEQNI